MGQQSAPKKKREKNKKGKPEEEKAEFCVTGTKYRANSLPEEVDMIEEVSSAGRDGASRADELANITDMLVQLLRLEGRSA